MPCNIFVKEGNNLTVFFFYFIFLRHLMYLNIHIFLFFFLGLYMEHAIQCEYFPRINALCCSSISSSLKLSGADQRRLRAEASHASSAIN